METKFPPCPRGDLLVQILSGIGKGCENEDLSVAGIDGVLRLFSDDPPKGFKLGVAGRVNLPSSGVERGEAVSILGKVLSSGRGPRREAAP